jgi:hypothetical protein
LEANGPPFSHLVATNDPRKRRPSKTTPLENDAPRKRRPKWTPINPTTRLPPNTFAAETLLPPKHVCRQTRLPPKHVCRETPLPPNTFAANVRKFDRTFCRHPSVKKNAEKTTNTVATAINLESMTIHLTTPIFFKKKFHLQDPTICPFATDVRLKNNYMKYYYFYFYKKNDYSRQPTFSG